MVTTNNKIYSRN